MVARLHPMGEDEAMIPDYLQDAEWLMCDCCAHVAYAPPHNGTPRAGSPRPGARCSVCEAHGPNHQGRLLLVRARLTVVTA